MAKVLTYKQDEYIWIICKRSVYIRQLRKSGPIVAPLKVKMATAYSIVCSGIELYQYCPVTREIVKMTVQNAYRVDKFPKYYAIITKGGANTKDDDDSEKGPAANMLMRATAPDPAANKSEEQEGEVTPDESKVTAGNEDEKTPDPAANVDDGAEDKETEENEAPVEGAVDADGVAENEEESESESDNEEDGEKETSEEKKEDKQSDASSNSGNKRKKKK